MTDAKQIIARTPRDHENHTTPGQECDCCLDVNAPGFKFVCECGATYGPGVLSFPRFWCYDCRHWLRRNHAFEAGLDMGGATL